MTTATISVIVPTLRPGPALGRLVRSLWQQSSPPQEIIIIDSSSGGNTVATARELGCRVEEIPRASFDHGGTRNHAVQEACGEALVFMTQDATPADPLFIAHLLQPLAAGCAAAYARQIPYPQATPLERFHRGFNYPPLAHRRSAADLARMGIRAAFFSNVASAVTRAAFAAVGGFPEQVIFNEDMIFACRLLRAGYQVAYAAEAQVFHSHDYGPAQQFRRYFDIGASHAQAGAVLGQLSAAREGWRFARAQCLTLARQGAWGWIPRAGGESVLKWAGFHIGRHAAGRPRLARHFSLQPGFWLRQISARASRDAASATP